MSGIQEVTMCEDVQNVNPIIGISQKEQQTKVCPKCKRELPVSEFGKRSERKSGLSSQCKECKREQQAANPEKAKERSVAWRKANPGKQRAYCIANAEKIKAGKRARYIIRKKEGTLSKRIKSDAEKQRDRERARAYNANNKEKISAYHKYQYSIRSEEMKEKVRLHRIAQRKKCFEYYGDKCDCCGESHYEFLVFDHINGGGNKHRKEINGMDMAKWLIENNFPKGFRVLCQNCNSALGHYGYCPHQRERDSKAAQANKEVS